jgi:ribosomal protein L32E
MRRTGRRVAVLRHEYGRAEGAAEQWRRDAERDAMARKQDRDVPVGYAVVASALEAPTSLRDNLPHGTSRARWRAPVRKG